MLQLLLILLTAAGPAEEFEAIREETDISKRKRMLTKFLKTRRPNRKSTDDDLAEVYNNAVRLAHAEKIKAKFVMQKTEVRRFGGTHLHFVFDRIGGKVWNWQPPKKHDVLVRRKAGVLSRGDARRLLLHFWAYDLDKGEIANPGGSPKRAAGVWLAHLQKRLTDSKVEKIKKRKFNRHYGSCWSFEIAGKNGQGKLEIHRCWFVIPNKGKLAMFQVIATDEKPDPELALMLASLRNG